MKLRRTTILAGIEKTLRDKIMPLLDDDFARNDVHLAASLLGIDRAFRDDEVALRVKEHDRIRAVFAQACGVVEDASLARRLKIAADEPTTDLRISALDTRTGQLRDLLVELHTHVETQDSDEARETDRAIWRLMRDTHVPARG